MAELTDSGSALITAGAELARGFTRAAMFPWPLVRSSTIFDLKYGKALVESSRRPGQIPVFGSNGVTGWHDTSLFKGPGVVLGRKGMGNLGVKWVDSDFWVIDTAYSLEARDDVDLRFAYYLVGYVGLNHLKHGSSNPSLTREAFGAQLFPLPPLGEQQRIAGALRTVDDLIDTNRTQVQALEELARCVAASSSREVELAQVARAADPRQVRPAGQVEHYSLPAFDAGATPEIVQGSAIQSSKLPVTEPCVLVSRLNPRWERCWMAYPGDSAVASTEFVQLLGLGVTPEEVWTVTSARPFWDQMRRHVTGTTGSHQRVDKRAALTLSVSDTRSLPYEQRQLLTNLVREAYDLRLEVADLTRTRDELLPLLVSGRIRVSESLAVT